MRDVIVIGCGGGGPVVAKELAARGLDVLVLEGGPRFANPEQEWSRLENDANNPTTGYYRVGPSDRERSAYPRALPQDSYVWQVAGVGGTTLHYYGNCPRAPRGVFDGYAGSDAANYDVDHRFPFAYEELLPYYEWVEATLPVQTAAMGTKESIFFRGAEGIGLPVNTAKQPEAPSFRPQENAILQPQGTAGKAEDPRFPDAQGCTFCGHCFQGCSMPRGAPRNLKAKRSTDNSYVPMMLTADAWTGGRPAELIADAFVQKIHTASGSTGVPRASGVTYELPDGTKHREDARIVVLAGGAVESPRLWRNSELPNPNGWVGRGFTDHHLDWVFGVFDEDTGNSKGASSSARADFPGYGGLENGGLPPGLQAFAQTFSDSGISGARRTASPATPAGADTLGRIVGRELLDSLQDVNRILNILVLTDDDVESQNGVSLLQPGLGDTNGTIPKITMRHRRRSARTLRNREFLAAKAVQILRAAGAKSVHRMDWPPLILHSQSTMRMGLSEADSVADAWAQSRAVAGLYIADNSVLANSAGAANPTLTTQAVATRTAERIFTEHFGGDPWVGREEPVCSIDDRVTEAVIARGL
ncbi:MAG: GMC family oxidoreductase [Solirubrobacteraceae bacterium]|nr:GMC family oxidoreductase [Solirubrobacteraceae bacterium]